MMDVFNKLLKIPIYSLPFNKLPEKVEEEVLIEKSKQTFDIGTLPKIILQIPENFDIIHSSSEEILALLPINSSFKHDYTHIVARFCYFNGIEFEKFIKWIEPKIIEKSKTEKHLKDKKYIENEINRWKWHWKNLQKFPNVSRAKIVTILKTFYPNITKDIFYREFSHTFFLPNEKIQKIETIDQTHFENSYKYNIFNVGMGGGKTAQTITFLSKQPNFLWISPNKALATNTHKRFDTDVFHYETMKTIDKKNGKLKEQNKLIICLNSLHYLGGCDPLTPIEKSNYNGGLGVTTPGYEVLIVDEIETLLDKFLGDFLEQGSLQLKKIIWNIFIKLFKNAKKIILLDAFTTKKTLNFINFLEEYGLQLPTQDLVIYERIHEPRTRTIKYLNNYDDMLQDIIIKLRDNKKIFIFYPFKKVSGVFNSMENLFNLFRLSTNKNGKFYNADVDDKLKIGLKDVNESWKDIDFIITNNIITCGVNYDSTDFDYKYIFIASHNSPRDSIQVSYRSRYLSSGIIYVCYLGKLQQQNSWLNDCNKMNCPIYNILYKQILIEKKSPLRRTFQLFCSKANYKQTTEKFEINSVISYEIIDILSKHNISMSYKKIPNIDRSIADMIEDKCFSQEATMIDKYALNKFYFKNSFLQSIEENIKNEEMIAEIWDNKYFIFFKKLSELFLDKKNVFNKISELNSIDTIFPINIKNVILNDEIKHQIFNEFSFKYISRKSSNCTILKEIYNTYFCKHIIKTEYYQNSKCLTYEMDEDINKYYDFAKNNLILDNLTYMTYNNIIKEEIGYEI